MSIAVPDRYILAESNQLIEYSSPSNSQTEALKQKANSMPSISLLCSINWLAIFGGSGLSNKKMFILQGLLHPQALDGVL